MRLNPQTRGRRFNKARSIHRKLGGIYDGNKTLCVVDISNELSTVQKIQDQLSEYKRQLLFMHNDLLGKPDKKPKKRSFFNKTE